MKQIGIYIKDDTTLEYNRVELFDDEKISITSSIQNINDISKTFTDFSQTFTVPATKQNNKIFKHWYDNSNDNPFSTLVKADAYIEIDTIPFRKGKIQLESANVVEGRPQEYSITFIGLLGNLKDKFAGKNLKDLKTDFIDDTYNGTFVKDKVTSNTYGSLLQGTQYPLISSKNYWTYGDNGSFDIKVNSHPIRYYELFPAITLKQMLTTIGYTFGISFSGTVDNPSLFISDLRFLSAYLWLKNADEFKLKPNYQKLNLTSITGDATSGYSFDFTNDKVTNIATARYLYSGSTKTHYFVNKTLIFFVTFYVTGKPYKYQIFKNGSLFYDSPDLVTVTASPAQYEIEISTSIDGTLDYYEFYVGTYESLYYETQITAQAKYRTVSSPWTYTYKTAYSNFAGYSNNFFITLSEYMPDIKVEDFFSGILKMFNMICISDDGVKYTLDTLENYYKRGNIYDLTKYVIQDKKEIVKAKTYKKINFEYEKSESIINKSFLSANNIDYGSLFYDTQNDGEEYNIKLPFEDLGFQRLTTNFQVGYALKTDLQKYITKPVILYRYDHSTTQSTSGNKYHFSENLIGVGTEYYQSNQFGQEYFDGYNTYSLNFPPQQSTLTQVGVDNGLYKTYYENYFKNIFNYKTRLVKIKAILPTSILTSLKLNDTIVIRDENYLINTMTTDLTSGEVQFELMTTVRDFELEEVNVNGQIFTSRNLDVTRYRNGDLIPQVQNATEWANLTTGAWCYYSNSGSNASMGKLYNWYAVNDSRGLAPNGWHIATNTEISELVANLGGLTVAGAKLKHRGAVDWSSGNAGTNEVGFGAVGSGLRSNTGTFSNLSLNANFWNADNFDTNYAYYWYLTYNSNAVVTNQTINKKTGMSVRLIKD